MSTARPTDLVSQRIREFRERRQPRWNQEDLARRILELTGQEVTPEALNSMRVTVARTEANRRRVTVDDLLLYAAALGVSPLGLILPEDNFDVIEIAPKLRLHAGLARDWIDETWPLRGEDIDAYADARERVAEGDFRDELDLLTGATAIRGRRLAAHAAERRDKYEKSDRLPLDGEGDAIQALLENELRELREAVKAQKGLKHELVAELLLSAEEREDEIRESARRLHEFLQKEKRRRK